MNQLYENIVVLLGQSLILLFLFSIPSKRLAFIILRFTLTTTYWHWCLDLENFKEKVKGDSQAKTEKKKLDSQTTIEKKKLPEKAADEKDKDTSVSLLKIQVGLIRKAWKHPSADRYMN